MNNLYKMKTLLFVANVDWFFLSHRMCLAVAAKDSGWKVSVACEDTGRASEIIQDGISFINLSFSRSGTNLIEEAKTIRRFYLLYKKINPDVVHHITLKPVIYGSFIARKVRVGGVLNAISGLGYTFTENRKGPVRRIMTQLMKFGFKHENLACIFQNRDDLLELQGHGILNSNNVIHLIKGSGVNLEEFKPRENKLKSDNRRIVLFPTRMLIDKGVRELRSATELLFRSYRHKISFILAGLADEENKAGVSPKYLKEWETRDYVKWVGYQRNMVDLYSNCDIVVLPSYREGMPKTLLEACAMGKPIITTNAIGCRECVDEEVNGLKVPVKSVSELANAIARLVDNPDLCKKMGKASRQKAVREFDQKEVVRKHLDIYYKLLNE